MKKRLVSVLLTVVMVLSLLPTAAFAVTVDNTYQPGSYTASAPGRGDKPVTVTLTLSQEDEAVVISDLQADGSTQTPDYWAIVEQSDLLDNIKKANGTTGVDVVSGATQSSHAVLNAVEAALAQATSAPSGSGTASDPYQIVNAAQLSAFAAAVDGGSTYAGEYVVLGADIDLSGIDSWNPIGDEAKDSANIFQGTFDGQGYSISGLRISTEVQAEGNYGLFSVLGNQAVVRNLSVTGVDMTITNTAEAVRVGVFAGDTEKTAGNGDAGLAARIDNCSATGTVNVTTTGDKMAFGGGMVGRLFNGGVVTNCWSDVDITVNALNGTKSAYAGGIAGTTGNYAVIANCATFGDVYAASPVSTNYGGMAGGLVGMLAGKQYNSYATGDITIAHGGLAKDHHWVGALDGQVTASGTTGSGTAYPAQGAVRSANYYAEDAVLKEEIYENNGATLKNTVTDNPVGHGFSTQQNYDKAMVSTAVARADMTDAAFADTLNGNISQINGLLAAYGITGIALREWQSDGGSVLPTGAVWTTGDISDSIFASGDGSAETPYLIATEAQLRDFAVSLSSKIDYTGKYVALANDIGVSSAAWTPIGGSQYLFNGTFDGRGYTISGLTLGTKDAPYALDKENLYIGLFGVLGTKSIVKNVNLTNVAFYTTYAATAYLGGIAGVTQGSTTEGDFTGALIDSCSVSGTLYLNNTKGNHFVGGLVGMQYKGATINSRVNISATGIVDGGDLAEVGGLAGQGGGIHLNCYSAGDVVSRQVTGDVGILNGRSAGISVQYNSYFNTDAVLKQGDTVIAPAKAVGTITTNATEINVVGKTAAELKSEAFAAQLNRNITASSLNAAIEKILEALTNQSGNGFTQQNYYEGNQLLSWTVRNNTVVFGAEAADAVTAAIDKLPSVSAVQYSNYQQYKIAVAAARASFEALSVEQQKLVDPDKLAELEELEKAIDGFQAIEVKDQLDKLPSAGDLTIKDQEAVKAAQEAYDKLTDEQKKYLSDEQVDKMEKLTDRMDEIIKNNPTPTPGGNGSGGKKPGQSSGKDVKSGNTGDAGISLYVGMGLVAVIACGALFAKRKQKED